MPSRLILNADDFGLTEGTNRAIIELSTGRAVTSATLMATSPAVEDAIAAAKSTPQLGVGCHITFIDGVPASDPSEITTLLGPDRQAFRASIVAFTIDVFMGRVRQVDLVHEGVAQVRRLQQAGLHITHLDTHKHTHAIPAVSRALLQIAAECGIRAIRNPFEPTWSLALSHGTFRRRALVWLMRQSFRRTFQQNLRDNPGIKSTDGTIGIAATGSLTVRAITDLLNAMPSTGTWEMVLHPGYPDQALAETSTRLQNCRDVERRALQQCIPTLSERLGPYLLHYGEIETLP